MEIFIDHVSNLAAKESHGVVRSLTRKARCKFNVLELTALRDYDVLAATLLMLDTIGVVPFSRLSAVGDATKRWGSLALVSREATLIENDPGFVDVILQYQHLLDGPNQLFRPAGLHNPTDPLFGKGKSSIREKTTNMFYPYGDRTLNPDGTSKRQQIMVSHQFPEWDTGIAASPFDPLYPRTVWQGGEVSIPFPESNFSFEATVITDDPNEIADALVARINSVPWLGKPALTWICSEVQWEMNSVAGTAYIEPTYKMRFEFQHNVDTWEPTVVFLDQRTNRPPSDVIAANEADGYGVKRLYYDPVSVSLTLTGGLIITGSLPRPAGLWQVPAMTRIDFDGYFVNLAG